MQKGNDVDVSQMRLSNYLRRVSRSVDSDVSHYVVTVKNIIQLTKRGTLRDGLGIFQEFPDDFCLSFSGMVKEILGSPKNVTAFCSLLFFRKLPPGSFDRFTVSKAGESVERDFKKWGELILERNQNKSTLLVIQFYSPFSNKPALSMDVGVVIIA